MGSFYSQEDNKRSFTVKEDEKDFKLEQDVQAYKDYAAFSRERDSFAANGRTYRSFAIIPDIVAIDILTKHKLDIHAPDFMHDPMNLRKLKQVIETDYPLLKTSNVRAL
jgi:hypothetical protein